MNPTPAAATRCSHVVFLPFHAEHDEIVRVIARPLQDRGLQVGVAAGGVGRLERSGMTSNMALTHFS